MTAKHTPEQRAAAAARRAEYLRQWHADRRAGKARPPRVNFTPAERLARRAELERKRRAALTPEQRTERRRRRYAIEIASRKPKPPKAPKPAHVRVQRRSAVQPPKVKPMGLIDCARRPVSPCIVTRPETVAEWMLRTGNRPEVLRGFEPVAPVRIPARQRVAGNRGC